MNSSYSKKVTLFFWTAFSLGLILRLAVIGALWSTPEKFVPFKDAHGYYELAESLLDYHSFAGVKTACPGSQLDEMRTTGYPAFIACWLALWRDPRAVALGQLLVLLVAWWLIYRYFQRAGNALAGALLVLALALSPGFVLDSVIVMPAVLCALLWLALAGLQVSACKSDQVVLSAAAGLVGASGALVKPVLLPFFLLSALVVPWFFSLSWSSRLVHSLVMLLCGMALLFPWMARNKALYGEYALCSVDGWERLSYVAANAEAMQLHQPRGEVEKRYFARIRASGVKGDLYGFATRKQMLRLALKQLRAHPKGFLESWLFGDLKNAFRPSDWELCRMFGARRLTSSRVAFSSIKAALQHLIKGEAGGWQSLVMLIETFLLLLMWPLAWWACFRLHRTAWREWTLYCALVMGYFFLVYLGNSEPRFRVGMLPFPLLAISLYLAGLLQRPRLLGKREA